MLFALIKKEFILLFRDWHGLLLLFMMPLIFIVIMSLALQDVFSQHADIKITVHYNDEVKSADTQNLLDVLSESDSFVFVSDLKSDKETAPLSLIIKAKPSLLFIQTDTQTLPFVLSVMVEPDTEPYLVTLFSSLLLQAQAQVYMQLLTAQFQVDGVDPDVLDSLSGFSELPQPTISYNYKNNKNQKKEKPNAVQQNVPAWLVFAMFFIAAPLSNALLSEEKSGTLRRLKTYHVSPALLLFSKLVPYFLINQLQVVAMLCAGIWLLPHLGGDSFSLGPLPLWQSIPALALLSAAISVMALGYALCIATAAKSIEQATTLGGVGNILLAALGGVMVPVFVMPEFMQRIAEFSPMYWGVQGYLDIVLRGGDISSVLGGVGQLLLTGLLLLGVANFLLSKRTH